ncbi:MAG: glycoside hydrolase family 127 protein, partial [Brachybacterium sp.]|nr:glycoside hydrolase family 127 protein [Brachybacterium sp.]
VYALEQQDQSGQALVDDAVIDPGAAVREQHLEELDGIVALDLDGHAAPAPADPATSPWPYLPWGTQEATADPATWRAIPYYAWANRHVGPMRVWLPVGTGS